ncbi:efflux ABC transporter, permease protein [Verrucomicrobiia bacterium DG1235]|nr:efflux ABC transporter, permease protein [Verrucomicrobiae bacterium DG1235]
MKDWIRISTHRLRSLFHSSDTRAKLDDEIAFHIEMLTEQNVKQGMSPPKARAAALREFGHVDSVREACKASWGVRLYEDFFMDLRDAIRQAMKRQGHTLVIVLTLGICLGSNTTALNFVQKIVSQPYDYEQADRILKVGMQQPKVGRMEVSELSIPKYEILKQNTLATLEVGLIDSKELDLDLKGDTQRVKADLITSDVWSITGVRPLYGHLFSAQEILDTDGKLAVLSESLANQLAQESQSLIGSTVHLDSNPYKVIGIVPNSFHLSYTRANLFLPRLFTPKEREASNRFDHSYIGIAKVLLGTSIEQARHSISSAYDVYLETYPEDRDDQERYGSTFASIPINESLEESLPQIGGAFHSIQIVTLIVLAIGCLNVSGMFLLKSYSRVHDFAMRKALGATNFRIVRQMVIEVCFYFFLGGLTSFLFLRAGFWAAEALYIDEIPWISSFKIDLFSLGATAAVALAAALLTAIVPTLSILRRDLNEYIKSGGRTTTSSASKHRIHAFFVTSQVSLSVILLVMAGILTSNLHQTLQKDIGFQKEGRIAFEVPQPTYRFGSGHDAYLSNVLPYQERALETIRTLPGVISASATNRIPMSPYHTGHSTITMTHHEYQHDEPRARVLRVTTRPGFFDTMDSRLLRGRDFAATDTFDTERVVIVSQNLVDKYYQDQEPIGSTLTMWGNSMRIVGVAEDMQDKPYFIPWDGYTLYFPYTQWSDLSRKYTVYIAHVQGDIEQQSLAIERALKRLDPQLTVVSTPLYETFEMATFAQRIPMVISIFFGSLALLLSGLGIYGLISYIVEERVKELGIRMAFGASPRRILKRVLGGSGQLVAWGLVVGLLIAIPVSIKINPILSDIDATNPAIFATVSAFVLAISITASFIPARRATQIDIAKTLKL